MKKRVGLAVVTYKDNFGSALQTFATQEILKELGYETKIFDITDVHSAINKKKINYYLKRIIFPDEFSYLIENFKSRTRKKSNNQNDSYKKNMAIRHKKYLEFNNKFLDFFDVASDWGKLSEQSLTCDYVLVGSDQLWRPSNIVGGYFTLEFVPDNIKKIAFATSFGVSEIPKSLHKRTKSFLQRINHISVRENTGAQIVKNLTGRNIDVVCDPTMMLDAEKWMRIQLKEAIVKEKYILCYLMGDNSKHREFVKKLKEITGYKVIGLLHGATFISDDERFVDEAPYDVGPSEFINLIRNAEYMCTDSFHGTVFSILNKTEFFVFRRYEDKSEFSTNDRLHTLLEWTGLENRMLYGTESIDKCINIETDFEDVLAKVDEKRKKAMEFLINALG